MSHLQEKIDDFNVHMLLCSTKKALMQRHDAAIKYCVKDLCAAAGLHVDVEASPFEKRESSDKKDERRPDLIIYSLVERLCPSC